MKVFMSVDMEGLAGISAPFQEKEDKVSFRSALHNQISWVVEGINKSSCNSEITEIMIVDAHGGGVNLSYSELSKLDDRISLVSGFPRPNYMMSCLDETFDVVFLVGYHAGPGKHLASMDHSFSSKTVANIKLNGEYVNEAIVNSAFASIYGVPVGLIIGDSGLYEELKDLKKLSWVEFVTTKKSLSKYAAKFYPMSIIKNDTIKKVKSVLDKRLHNLPLFEIKCPIEMTIKFKSTSMADIAEQIPKMERISGLETKIICSNMAEVESGIIAIIFLASQSM